MSAIKDAIIEEQEQYLKETLEENDYRYSEIERACELAKIAGTIKEYLEFCFVNRIKLDMKQKMGAWKEINRNA